MAAPPGEYERVLLRFGEAPPGRDAGDTITTVEALARIAPHLAKVVCSRTHCLAMTHRGELYCVPNAALEASGTNLPSPLELDGEVAIDIAAGDAHFLAVTDTGLAYAWGAGLQGQLGTGRLADAELPQRVKGLDEKRVVGVAAGAQHSIAWTADGYVYGFGSGRRGQLGRPNVLLAPAAHLITPLLTRRIVRAVARGDATVFLDATGRALVCGDGTAGLLGHGHGRTVQSPVELPLPPAFQLPVKDVALGWGHLVALDAAGALWACGTNTKGQLGYGSSDGKYDTLSQVPLHRPVPPVEREVAWLEAILPEDTVPGARRPPAPSPPSPAPVGAPVSSDGIVAGGFWTAVTANGELFVWGSLGPTLALHTAPVLLNSHLPPFASVVAAWPQQDSVLVLVDLFVAHAPIDLLLSVATLGAVDPTACKAFALQNLQAVAPQVLASAHGVVVVDIVAAFQLPGDDEAIPWTDVLLALTGAADTPYTVEQSGGLLRVGLPPDPTFLPRVLRTETVGGLRLVPAECSQTVAVTLYGPPGRLEAALDACRGRHSGAGPLVPPLYTIDTYKAAS